MVKGGGDGLDWLVLEGECHAEGDDDADGVFVAAAEDFFGGEEEAVALHGDLAKFDVEVAAELVPADLYRACDEVGAVRATAGDVLTLSPVPLEGEAA